MDDAERTPQSSHLDVEDAQYAAKKVADDRQTPPMSRFRQRSDGGVDRTHRVNFFGALTPEEMRFIVSLLLDAVSDEEIVGHIALTKIEFIEPDTCEYRFWCEQYSGAQTTGAIAIWTRLNQIHPVRNVDGLWPSADG